MEAPFGRSSLVSDCPKGVDLGFDLHLPVIYKHVACMVLSGRYQKHQKTNAADNSDAPLLTEEDFAEIEAFANAGVLVSA